MKTTLQLTLTKAARSYGGDKYEGTTEYGHLISVYLPQSISRRGGSPIQSFEMTLQPLPLGKEK